MKYRGVVGLVLSSADQWEFDTVVEAWAAEHPEWMVWAATEYSAVADSVQQEIYTGC